MSRISGRIVLGFRWLAFLRIALVCLLICLSTRFSTAQDRTSISLEEALVLKMMGDEYFLRDQRTEALEFYRKAADILRDEVWNLSSPNASPEVMLLNQELAYRRSLAADPRMDFWGAQFSTSAVEPVAALLVLNNHLQQLQAVANQVSDAIEKLRTNQGKDIDTQVNAEKSAAEKRLGELQKESAQVTIDYTERRIEQSRDRINQTIILADGLRQKQVQKLSELNAAEQKLKSAVLSAVGKAAGLPIDLNSIADGKSLDEAMVQAAAGLAGSQEFAESMKQLSGSAGQVAEVYQNGKQLLEKAKTYSETAQKVRDVVTNPTFSNALKAGGAIYQHLSEADKHKFEKLVTEAKPLLPLIALANGEQELREAIDGYLRQTGLKLPVNPDFSQLSQSFQNLANEMKDPEGPKKAFDEIAGRLSEKGRERLINELASIDIAFAYEKSNPAALPTNRQTQQSGEIKLPPNDVNATDGAAAVQALVVGGVSAAFPPAAVAAAGIEIVQSLSSIRSLAAEINSLSEQTDRLTVEEMHLREIVSESLYSNAQAQVDGKMAVVRAHSAVRQLQLWDQAIDSITSSDAEQRSRIRYRLSYMFYLMERLRQDFDRLDRALGMWTGALEHNRGNLKRAMTSNPDLRRLALDRDIQLYDWLNRDKADEQRRDDVDRIATYWTRVSALITDILQDYAVSPNGGGIGDVAQTSGYDGTGVPLRRLVGSAEWDRFTEWQTRALEGKGDGRPYVFTIVITPGGLPGIEPLVPLENSLRIVTVRMGDIAAGGQEPISSNVIKLIHPGISFIPLVDDASASPRVRFVREVLAPDEYNLDAPNKARDTNDRFRSRWKPGYRLLPFEGYGLYGVWHVMVNPDDRNYRLADIRINFIYQYIKKQGLRPDQGFVETLRSQYSSLQVSTKYLKLLTSSGETLESKVKEWQSSPLAAQLPWTHGVVTQEPLPTGAPSSIQETDMQKLLRSAGTPK